MTGAVLVSVACVMAVLGIGGRLTTLGPWYDALRKPAWQPPGWLFGPAWTLIGALTAWAAVLAWRAAAGPGARAEIIALFAVNAALNIAWSGLFFRLRRPDWAFAEVLLLWLSVAALLAGLARIAPLSGWLLAPYLAWVGFAAVLNLAIVRRNRPFHTLLRRDGHGSFQPE